jgi:putative SOS response-associated peptidase YedK
MCGRYSLTSPAEAMRRLFGFGGPLPNWPAHYNIAPTQLVPIVRLAPSDGRGAGRGADRTGQERGHGRARELAQVRWGFIPFWAKEAGIGAKLINARAEGIAEKPAFRAAFRARRCLVPADGFYEWQKTPRGKRPYRAGLKGGTPEAMALFAFAGLWERWEKAADGVPVESCAIVTTDANALLRPIHDRMPVILDPADHVAWLDPETPAEGALALLRPYPVEAMIAYPVSSRVNNVRCDDPACIAPEPDRPDLL